MKYLLWLKSNSKMYQIFGEAAFKSHAVSVNVCHYSCDLFHLLLPHISSHKPKLSYWRLCFHAPLSHWEIWLAFPPLVGVSVAGYFKGMVKREVLSSVTQLGFVLAWHIQVGVVMIVLKRKSFHQKTAGGHIKCACSAPFPGWPRNMWKMSFFWRKACGMSLSRGGYGITLCVFDTVTDMEFIHVLFVCVWFYDNVGWKCVGGI